MIVRNYGVGLYLCVFTSMVVASDDFTFRIESKVHYRNSEENRFPVKFPFPSAALPLDESSAFIETVDSGEHLEISTLNLHGLWRITPNFSTHFKLELIDKYDRNPTSSDRKIDLDSAFFRYGKHSNATNIPDERTYYVQLGKFGKFERQRERRTESYGLVSTAFNRFEDSGVELGFDLPNGLYAKGTWTTGNPVFFRDPNALAGDNGTSERIVPPENTEPALKSGIVILYDAEIERFDLGDESEIGAGIGYRWNSSDKSIALSVLAFAYERELAEQRSLHGTFYGADLDLFDLGEIPGAEGIRLPAQGNKKSEVGANLWFNVGNFALFGQYIDQDMANLGREGKELEVSYIFDFPVKISPVIRFSDLDNDFVGSPLYPAPSVWWDWKKIDYAVNIDFSDSLRMTVEYADNQFVRGGKTESNNETLVTFRWQY